MECTYDSRGRTRPTFVSLSICSTAKVPGALKEYPVCVCVWEGVKVLLTSSFCFFFIDILCQISQVTLWSVDVSIQACSINGDKNNWFTVTPQTDKIALLEHPPKVFPTHSNK